MKGILSLALLIACLNSLALPPDSLTKVKADGQMVILHEIDKGETLYSVSKKYHTSIEVLIASNKALKDSVMIEGMVIKIPSNDGPQMKLPEKDNAGPQDVALFHVVKSGETLYSIARENGVGVGQIKKWNELEGDQIMKEQLLVVGWMNSNAIYKVSETKEDSKKKEASNLDLKIETKDAKSELGNEEQSTLSLAKKEPELATPASPLNEEGEVQRDEQLVRYADFFDYMASNDQMEVNEQLDIATWMKEESNKNLYALHKTIPAGSLVKVKNMLNGEETYIKILGKMPDTGANKKVSLILSNYAANLLGALDTRFQVQLTYYSDIIKK